MGEHSGVPTDLQQEVFDLMRDRLMELFGPGGSFRVTLGRATADEALFADTVAETVAWQVAAALTPQQHGRSQHAADREPLAEYEELWAHVERELRIRRHLDPLVSDEDPPAHGSSATSDSDVTERPAHATRAA